MFRQLSTKTKVMLILFSVYLVIPLDLIPEIILGFTPGLIDDVGLFAYTFNCLKEDLKIVKKLEN